MQVVHDRLGSGNDTRNESTVPKHTTTSKTSSIAKKPNNTSGHNRLHSDSDDNNDTDDLHIIKSLPGAPKTIKTTSGAASRGQGLIYFKKVIWETSKVFYCFILARELRFNVEYKDHTETITMLDNETIREYYIHFFFYKDLSWKINSMFMNIFSSIENKDCWQIKRYT